MQTQYLTGILLQQVQGLPGVAVPPLIGQNGDAHASPLVQRVVVEQVDYAHGRTTNFSSNHEAQLADYMKILGGVEQVFAQGVPRYRSQGIGYAPYVPVILKGVKELQVVGFESAQRNHGH